MATTLDFYSFFKGVDDERKQRIEEEKLAEDQAKFEAGMNKLRLGSEQAGLELQTFLLNRPAAQREAQLRNAALQKSLDIEESLFSKNADLARATRTNKVNLGLFDQGQVANTLAFQQTNPNLFNTALRTNAALQAAADPTKALAAAEAAGIAAGAVQSRTLESIPGFIANPVTATAADYKANVDFLNKRITAAEIAGNAQELTRLKAELKIAQDAQNNAAKAEAARVKAGGKAGAAVTTTPPLGASGLAGTSTATAPAAVTVTPVAAVPVGGARATTAPAVVNLPDASAQVLPGTKINLTPGPVTAPAVQPTATAPSATAVQAIIPTTTAVAPTLTTATAPTQAPASVPVGASAPVAAPAPVATIQDTVNQLKQQQAQLTSDFKAVEDSGLGDYRVGIRYRAKIEALQQEIDRLLGVVQADAAAQAQAARASVAAANAQANQASAGKRSSASAALFSAQQQRQAAVQLAGADALARLMQ